MRWLFSGLYNSIPLICMSSSMPVPHRYDYCRFIASFEISVSVPALFFFFKKDNGMGFRNRVPKPRKMGREFTE